MSNQVYLNATSKFFNWNGQNYYFPKDFDNVSLEPATSGPIATSLVLNQGDSNSIQIPNMVSINNSGLITFTESGMFSVKVLISCTSPANMSSIQPLLAELIKSEPGSFNNVRLDVFEVEFQVNLLSSKLRHSLSYTGYFEANTSLWVYLTNLGLEDYLTVVALESALIVSRIY